MKESTRDQVTFYVTIIIFVVAASSLFLQFQSNSSQTESNKCIEAKNLLETYRSDIDIQIAVDCVEYIEHDLAISNENFYDEALKKYFRDDCHSSVETLRKINLSQRCSVLISELRSPEIVLGSGLLIISFSVVISLVIAFLYYTRKKQ